MNKKDIRLIAIIRLYSKGEYTYTNSDRYVYLPFIDELEMDGYLNKVGLGKKTVQVNKVKINNKIITLVYLKSISLALGSDYFKDVTEETIKLTQEVYNKCVTEIDRIKAEKKKQEGFVNYKYPMNSVEIKGKLTFLLTQKVINYIGSGKSVWGYLGHSYRQLYMDEYIEKTINRVVKFLEEKGNYTDVVSVLENWITTSSARHWMDSVEDYNRNEFKRAFKDLYIRLLRETNLELKDIEAIKNYLR